jgi:hypothetical protein
VRGGTGATACAGHNSTGGSARGGEVASWAAGAAGGRATAVKGAASTVVAEAAVCVSGVVRVLAAACVSAVKRVSGVACVLAVACVLNVACIPVASVAVESAESAPRDSLGSAAKWTGCTRDAIGDTACAGHSSTGGSASGGEVVLFTIGTASVTVAGATVIGGVAAMGGVVTTAGVAAIGGVVAMVGALAAVDASFAMTAATKSSDLAAVVSADCGPGILVSMSATDFGGGTSAGACGAACAAGICG